MSFIGVKNTKVNGGLGRRNPSTDARFGLVAGGVAASGIALGDVKKLIQLDDAVALGITPSYDSINSVRLYEHIQQFFEFQPNGTLYIKLVSQGTTQEAMVDVAGAVRDLALSAESEKQIKYIGTVLNPVAAPIYAPVTTNGIDVDVEAAIPKAQALIDALAQEHVFIDGIMLEGRNVTGTVAALVDLRTKAAANVSVCIAADPTIINLNTAYQGSASVGTALGNLAVRKVSENLGSVNIARKPDAKKGQPNYSLTNAANSTWLTAALTSGVLFTALTAVEKQALTDKGYIYAGNYEGYPGIYFNDGSTAVELASDFAYIEANRVWNKAARLVRFALIPKMNSEVEITDVGTIEATVIEDWKASAKKQLDGMLADEEISNYTFFIDAAQNVLGGNPIITKLSVIPKGIARAIENELGFENPFNV